MRSVCCREPPRRVSFQRAFPQHSYLRQPSIVNFRVLPTSYTRGMSATVQLSDEEWRMKLTPQQFAVLRQNDTERAGSGEYNKCKDKGVYHCVGCDNPLYKSEAKFDSGCGWPAFFEAIPGALTIKEDVSHGMRRVEMRCAKCDGHLGHIFKNEGFKNPTNERHCVNSVCLKLVK